MWIFLGMTRVYWCHNSLSTKVLADSQLGWISANELVASYRWLTNRTLCIITILVTATFEFIDFLILPNNHEMIFHLKISSRNTSRLIFLEGYPNTSRKWDFLIRISMDLNNLELFLIEIIDRIQLSLINSIRNHNWNWLV